MTMTLLLTGENPATNIPYGYVYARALNQKTVAELLHGKEAVNHSYQEHVCTVAQNLGCLTTDFIDACEFLSELEKAQVACSGAGLFEEGALAKPLTVPTIAELLEFECLEPLVSGIYQDVSYQTSYIGGELGFFIFDSPKTTKTARPFYSDAPGCVLLDTLDGFEYGYNVPDAWRAEEVSHAGK